MRVRTLIAGAITTVVATLSLSGSALAQNKAGFNVEKYEPSERGSDWFANESLDFRGHLRPAAGLVATYSYRPLVLFKENGNVLASTVRNSFYIHPGASLVLFDRFRLAFNMPIQAGVDGHTGTVVRDGVPTTFIDPPNSGGLGDLRLSADARLLGVYGDPFTLAVGAQVFLPTGDEAQWASDGKVRVRPRAMVAGDIDIFTYAASAGVHVRTRHETFGPGQIGTEFNLTAAAGVKILDKKLVVGPELWASTVFDAAFERKTTPGEVALGAHYLVADQIRVGAAASTGLNRSYGAPVYRYIVGIEWAPGAVDDRDGDGIKDSEDACPDTKGVRSAEPSKNGCPAIPAPPPAAPSDRDNDAIIDSEDACPDVAGVRTGDPATNGCKDTDGDGFYDPKDACPNDRGIASTDPTFNGCPDGDGDGVFDKVDACPREAGPKSEDPKKNGCPIGDKDKDGIKDDVDACPDDPGPADPDPKRNGCPKAFISQGQIKILDQVKFKVGSAAIETGKDAKDSTDVLEAVLKVLKDHPEIKKVRIEGHTDNTGAAKLNKKLSADRAAAVVKWLTGHGVDAKRLSSEGFGPDKPIDTNETEQGKKNNRRVEFHIEFFGRRRRRRFFLRGRWRDEQRRLRRRLGDRRQRRRIGDDLLHVIDRALDVAEARRAGDDDHQLVDALACRAKRGRELVGVDADAFAPAERELAADHELAAVAPRADAKRACDAARSRRVVVEVALLVDDVALWRGAEIGGEAHQRADLRRHEHLDAGREVHDAARLLRERERDRSVAEACLWRRRRLRAVELRFVGLAERHAVHRVELEEPPLALEAGADADAQWLVCDERAARGRELRRRARAFERRLLIDAAAPVDVRGGALQRDADRLLAKAHRRADGRVEVERGAARAVVKRRADRAARGAKRGGGRLHQVAMRDEPEVDGGAKAERVAHVHRVRGARGEADVLLRDRVRLPRGRVVVLLVEAFGGEAVALVVDLREADSEAGVPRSRILLRVKERHLTGAEEDAEARRQRVEVEVRLARVVDREVAELVSVDRSGAIPVRRAVQRERVEVHRERKPVIVHEDGRRWIEERGRGVTPVGHPGAAEELRPPADG